MQFRLCCKRRSRTIYLWNRRFRAQRDSCALLHLPKTRSIIPLDARSPEKLAIEPDGLPPERRRWAIFAIFIAVAMASLDTAIANVALPAIAADLHVSPADVVWVVSIYQIVMVATLLPFASLGEIVGHQRIYLGGLILFALASLLCAPSHGRCRPCWWRAPCRASAPAHS